MPAADAPIAPSLRCAAARSRAVGGVPQREKARGRTAAGRLGSQCVSNPEKESLCGGGGLLVPPNVTVSFPKGENGSGTWAIQAHRLVFHVVQISCSLRFVFLNISQLGSRAFSDKRRSILHSTAWTRLVP